jgi:putative transposase
MINVREGWRGHLWQSRFASFPMDESYLLAAVRYVELSPVKAGLCAAGPEFYRWSSAAAHVAGEDDVLVRVAPILERVPDWRGFLAAGDAGDYAALYERHGSTGRPLGPKRFVVMLEKALGRVLQPRKRGRKPSQGGN